MPMAVQADPAPIVTMESSRIFIKGLPPNMTEDEFKQHFAAKNPITDAKLVPRRRIGYIGYKTPEEAARAVKYFNRSYIRMSRIGVELARPFSDAPTTPAWKKLRKDHVQGAPVKTDRTERDNVPSSETTLKRKRSDADGNDPKLKEFLDVMGKPKLSMLADTQVDEQLDEPPRKVQALELPEAESDDEYESLPTKARKAEQTQSQDRAAQLETAMVAETAPAPTVLEEPVASTGEIVNKDLTDDDWLRSRSNRLLDLVDPEDMPVEPTAPRPSESALATVDPDISMIEPDEIGADPDVEPEQPVEETKDHSELVAEAVRATGRLFVRNLTYSATEDDLRELFGKYGHLEEAHLPVSASGKRKGFALIQFTNPDDAVEAWQQVGGNSFQGRLLHIIPASAKREKKLDEFEIAKLPLKKQRELKKKSDASSNSFNWNSLYMNQDSINASIADRLGVSKSEMLDPTSSDAGVKQAIAETSIIQETKAYFTKNGVDLNAFKTKERGDTAMLVKNFPYGTSMEELRKMFETYGQVLRVLMPPAGTIAIVEFAQPTQARAAFASMAYRRIKDSVLFLEKAPRDLFTSAPKQTETETVASGAVGQPVDVKPSVSDLLDTTSMPDVLETSTLFVRNLNFSTTTARLSEVFRPIDGFMSARVVTKNDPKKPGQVLSMGYGFLEFKSKQQALTALKAMDGFALDNHKLILKASQKGLDAAEEQRREDRAKKVANKQTKIIIKNLPFEATKKDVRALLSTYGKLRSVRVPKKFDNSVRGFAFADFGSAREAENALEALKDTHLLGRRLVLDYASAEALDAEEEIEKMQAKVGKQVNKVMLQKLTGGGRKKFNIDDNGEQDD